MRRGAQPRPSLASAALSRGALFSCLWLALSGWKAMDLLVGLVAVAAATWTSLALLPATGSWPRFGALAAFVLSFLRGSLMSGIDVALRALRPALDLRPGLVTVPLRVPPGHARNAFCALSSLMPGTLPVGIDATSVLIHSLDVTQPIAQSLAREEALFIRVIGDE